MKMHFIAQAFEEVELIELAQRAETRMARERPFLISDEDRYEALYEYLDSEISQYMAHQDYDDIITAYLNENWHNYHSQHAALEAKGDEQYLAHKDGGI